MSGAADRLREHPRERLAAAVRKINVGEEAARLRAEPHPRVAGHRQVVLVRRGPIAVVLFVFETDGFLREHRTEGEVVIQVIAGSLQIAVAGDDIELGPGEILSLAPGEPHAVRARRDSEMLLTVCRAGPGQGAD